MRRENRRQNLQGKISTDKIILYAGIGVAILAVIVFALFLYSKNLSDDVKNSTMSLEQMASMANNNTTTQNTESASTEIGKSVEESTKELNTTKGTNTNSNVNTINNNTKVNQKSNTSNTNNMTTNKNTNVTTNAKAEEKETKNELSFIKPVEGEIAKEYAKDNLIYSATLEEWTTHTGMDIKADKTTVVKAAESGTVKTIKNDPRYGLTIVIEHEDNMQTIYSNLLTSEFVVEGEKVEKGQSIGTVGNTAVFEIADEPHLHFEILKDSLPVDPSIYIK